MSDHSFYKQTTMPDFAANTTPSTPMPKQIGPYRIEGLLNKGGMSFLYLGLHPQTKQPLAIKVLSPAYVTHADAIERFFKEAHIIELANHPNIVKLYGQGQWEGGLFIAMELIRGVSLRQFIMQQSLSLKRSLDIVLQVAHALLHLHSHGVIHRDLKPENILITEDGEIKVIDFGIAQLHADAEKMKKEGVQRIMGTPNYMSPEQKQDSSQVSYASDIYSLGIIAYELCLGKLSYGVVNLTFLPKGLRKIIEKSLAVSVQERYSNIADFIADVSQYLTSGEMDREKPGNDQLKEVMESMQKAQQNLCPPEAPNWSLVEIGIAKYRGGGQMGWYYDFFKLPNNTYLVILAESEVSGFNGTVYIGVFRGMVRTLIAKMLPADASRPFDPAQFMDALNRMVSEDTLGVHFAISILLLNPRIDEMSYISCGMGNMFHIPQGTRSVRKFPAQNSLIGIDANASFSSTSDNWNDGDLLILHTLDVFENGEYEKNVEPSLLDSISETITLSAQSQAEAVLKKLALLPAFSLQSTPKALIVIQRIN